MRTRLVLQAVRLRACLGSLDRASPAAWLLRLGLVLLLLGAPRLALADGPQRVAVYVQGTDAKTVRKEITELIPAGIEVDKSAFGRSLEERGFVRDPKFDTHKKLGERVVKALNASNADLAVVVRVNKQRVAHVLVFRRGEPAPQLDETLSLGKKSGSDAEKAALSAKLSAVFPSAPPPVEEKPAEEPEPAEEAEAAPAVARAEPKPSEAEPPPSPSADGLRQVTLALSIGVGARDFEFTRRVTQNLRPYSIWGIGLAELELEAYPFAKSAGALKNFGLLGSFMMALPFRTEVEDVSGVSPKTYYQRFDAGLRYRIPFAPSSALFISAAFSGQDFTFGSAGDLSTTVPSTRYRSFEPGLGAKIAAGPVVLAVGAGYRFVLSGGKVLDRFPQASLGAIAAHLGAGLPLGRSAWEVRLLTRYERYFYSMNASTDDVYVAGGALDQYFTLLGGLSYGF